MRLIYIRAFRLSKLYFYILLTASAALLLGLNSVFANNEISPATSWAVANRTIVIDPGHGGIDPGAVGFNGLEEKEIVLQISKRLKQVLTHAGAKVVMTRETDIDYGTPGSGSLLKRKREDLSKRVAMANDNNASVFLSIHVNAFPSSRWSGAQTFYQSKEAEGKLLAECIQSELIRIMGNTTRAAKHSDFYATRNTKMPGVIVEVGFISNPAEAKLLKSAAYQRKIAYAIYSGLAKYYAEELKEKGESSETKKTE
ncbi:MAG TPA: N-acetylmuramoyl-L-alanine amidase CwlD [Desulfobacteria bacterium]|nr:N-acetylmuramoyl-L-alanine amidase CwlD [Desulfobacteria bacterium]